MSFKLFFTMSRPDANIPFWEQTGDGRVRTLATIEISDNNPDLMTRVIPIPLDDNPDLLVYESTYIFEDFSSWNIFRDMINQLDPTFRDDRITYYQANGHSLKIEYQDDSMDEKEVTQLVTAEKTTFHRLDGVINVRYPNGVSEVTYPNGDVETMQVDGLKTLVKSTGVVIVTYPNGDIETTQVDGSKTLVKSDSSSVTDVLFIDNIKFSSVKI
jgi:hypothetical protein